MFLSLFTFVTLFFKPELKVYFYSRNFLVLYSTNFISVPSYFLKAERRWTRRSFVGPPFTLSILLRQLNRLLFCKTLR